MKHLLVTTTALCIACVAPTAAETPYFRYSIPGTGGAANSSTPGANPNENGGGTSTQPADVPLAAADSVGNNDPAGVGLRYESVQGMVGTAFQATPVPRNVTAGKAKYTLVKGTLPGTLKLDPGTGTITGTPNATGTYPLGIQVEDTSNGGKVAVPVDLSVIGFASVADVLPVISYGGMDITGYLADASTDTGSAMPGNGYVTFGYDATRMADQLNIAGTTGSWTLDGLSSTGAWMRLAQGSAGGSFPFSAFPGQQFRIGVASAYLQTATLLYKGAAQVAPTVNPPAAQSISYGAGLGSLTLSAGYLQGSSTWSVAGGSLPDGVTLAPGGTFAGTANQYGTFVAQVAVRDARTQSAPVPLTISVTSPYSAKDYLPTGASKGSVAALYDNDPGADSFVGLSAGESVVLTFDRAVKGTGLSLQGTFSGLTLEYLDGQTWRMAVIAGSGSLAPSFAPYYATQWRLTAINGPATLGGARLTDAGSAPFAPSVNAASVSAAVGGAVNVQLTAANATASASPAAPTYALVSGTWPTGITMGSDGLIKGSTSTAGTTTVKVAVTDARGVVSAPRTVSVTITAPVYTAAKWDATQKSPSMTVSVDGQTASNALNGTWQGVIATVGKSTGKWYYEASSNVADATFGLAPNLATANGKIYAGDVGSGGIVIYTRSGQILQNNAQVGTGTYGSLVGSVVMVAWDGSTIWFGKDGTWLNGNPASGTGGTAYAPGRTVFPSLDLYSNTAPGIGLFETKTFKYTPPPGFSPWQQ